MIQIVGLIVAAYVFARCLAEVCAGNDGRITIVGRIAYGVCFVATVLLTGLLLASGTHAPQ